MRKEKRRENEEIDEEKEGKKITEGERREREGRGKKCMERRKAGYIGRGDYIISCSMLLSFHIH